jgi:N,N'-diacetyllegionaminate synthase
MFNTTVGFSDHTMDTSAAQLALASGAEVFEKHVTLSRLMDGVDHKASVTFDEFKKYINDLQQTLKIMGSYNKKCLRIEKQTKLIARKSLVAKKKIKRGEGLNETNITSKRPGNGISPKFLAQVMNKKAKKDISIGQTLQWADLD